jgi:AFG3 family protein
LIKVTIIPRSKGALGFTQYVPDNMKLHSKEHIYDMISAVFGGRVAEELLIGSITTGASDDLQKATQMAHGMITRFGMSKLGMRVVTPSENEMVKKYSEQYEEVLLSYIRK